MAVPTDKEMYESMRATAQASLAEVLEKKLPNYYVGGKRYDWADYVKVLQGQIDWLDRKLQQAGDRVLEDTGIVLY